MKKSYLFPNHFKRIGWFILIPSFIYFILSFFIKELNFEIKIGKIETNMFLTVLPVLIILGLIFIAYSKQKIEDEYISKIREQSLVWSLIVFTVIEIIHSLVYPLYESDSGGVPEMISAFVIGMILINFKIYIFIITFIVKFNYELYKLDKSLSSKANKPYLLPNKFKKTGWIIIIISVIYFIIESIIARTNYYTIININENLHKIKDISFIFWALLYLGFLFVCLSKEKTEDEYITQIREKSLIWSVFIFLFSALFVTITCYGLLYLSIIGYISFLPYVIFIIKFNFELYKSKKLLRYEE